VIFAAVLMLTDRKLRTSLRSPNQAVGAKMTRPPTMSRETPQQLVTRESSSWG